jgi:hypothetical protein
MLLVSFWYQNKVLLDIFCSFNHRLKMADNCLLTTALAPKLTEFIGFLVFTLSNKICLVYNERLFLWYKISNEISLVYNQRLRNDQEPSDRCACVQFGQLFFPL